MARWLTVALFACATSALGKTYEIGIGDICDPGMAWPSQFVPIPNQENGYYAGACFSPAVLTIDVGDSVHFYQYADTMFSGAHNVVADDGSFRCALGCDGEGGDGTPRSDSVCTFRGCGHSPPNLFMNFTREFDVPGVVQYHDEVTGAPGVIYVGVSPPTPIDSGYTGTWFNAAQGGMGFLVEVLPGSPMQMLASWLTFSAQGDPSWIVGLGPINGDQATLQATQTVGGGARFPPHFDPNDAHAESWGLLTFTFSDCNHAHVDWSSTIQGYGSGGMDLTRLTQPVGVICSASAAASTINAAGRPQ
jgi:plastocyanin